MFRKRFLLFVLVVTACSPIILRAQANNDTIVKEKKKVKIQPQAPYHWNVIKFNPTPMLIQAVEIRNLTLSYERLINKKMSMSMQAGYLVFPNLITDTVLRVINIHKGTKNGINLAVDYRYYPFQRNRKPAPDGLYIGAYLSYYGFQFKNNFDFIDSAFFQNADIKGKLNIVHLGFELGYQFIFWKRFSVDLLLFGPSLAYNHGELTIGGNLNPEMIKDLDEELVQKLRDRFPLINALVSGEELKFTGTRSNFGIGFRYSIQLGFHF